MNFNKDEVYEAIAQVMSTWNWVQSRDVDLGISNAPTEIGLYTNKRDGYPIRFAADGVWTFRNSITPDMTIHQYAEMCVTKLIELSRALPGKMVVEFPSDASILQSKRCKEHESMSDSDYTAYVRYMFATQQTCMECHVGEIDVDIGSYEEIHTCLNCGDINYVR